MKCKLACIKLKKCIFQLNNGKTSQYKEIDSKENKIEVKDKNDSTITINSSILTMLPEKLDQTKTSANANSNFVT